MKLRIAQGESCSDPGAGLEYWVEQRRWFVVWRKCYKFGSIFYKSIRFDCETLTDYVFYSREEAVKYAKDWWLNFSRLGKSKVKKQSYVKNKIVYTEIDLMKENTISLLKDGLTKTKDKDRTQKLVDRSVSVGEVLDFLKEAMDKIYASYR
jgi:hypothetical protein